jgi:hypothetical protein
LRDDGSFRIGDPIPEVTAGESVADLAQEVVAGHHLDLARADGVEQQRRMALRLGDDGREQDARVEN